MKTRSEAGEKALREALEKAFDYRGDVTLVLQNGEKLEGFVFDRQASGSALEECYVRLIPNDRPEKLKVSYLSIDRVEFTGRDTADGKSFRQWERSYRERKARGEKGLSIHPDPLD